MSASVADDLIRSYFDRWQRLEEEKRTVSDDLKELFAEAKGNGLDTKALRTVFREQVGDRAAIEEFDAVCDLYRASLSRPRAGRADAREKTLNNFVSMAVEPVQKTHEFDPETGEIIETQESSDGMASGSEHLSATSANQGESDAKSEQHPAAYPEALIFDAGQDGSAAFLGGEHQHSHEDIRDEALAGSVADEISASFPHSTVATPPAIVEQPEAPNSSPATSGDNSAPVIGHVSFATSSHINPDDTPEIPAFLRRDFERAEA